MEAQIHVRKIAKIFTAEGPFTFWRRIRCSIPRRYFIFLKRLLAPKWPSSSSFLLRLVETSLDVEHYLDMKIPAGGKRES